MSSLSIPKIHSYEDIVIKHPKESPCSIIVLFHVIFSHDSDVTIRISVRNKPATEPVILKVYNVKLSFNI